MMRPVELPEGFGAHISRLREFQEQFGAPVADVEREAPQAALASLREAVDRAPAKYAGYLQEALRCYAGGQLRAATLMVWASTIQHLYLKAEGHQGGIKKFEVANQARYGSSKGYRPIRKTDDFLYLKESQFLVLGEDAGLYNRNARRLLEERLELRNRCGHPTGYEPGREEVVIFIESLLLNVLGDAQLNW